MARMIWALCSRLKRFLRMKTWPKTVDGKIGEGLVWPTSMVHNLPFSALLSFCHLSVYLWNLGCYDSDVHGRMSHGCGQFSAHQRHQVVRLQVLVQGVQAAHYSCLAGCFGGCTWWGGCRPTRLIDLGSDPDH